MPVGLGKTGLSFESGIRVLAFADSPTSIAFWTVWGADSGNSHGENLDLN